MKSENEKRFVNCIKKDEKETRHYQVMRKCKKVEFARGQIAVHHYREERRR